MENKKSKSNSETIGNKIQKARNKLGFTQEKLAVKAEIPYATLTKI